MRRHGIRSVPIFVFFLYMLYMSQYAYGIEVQNEFRANIDQAPGTYQQNDESIDTSASTTRVTVTITEQDGLRDPQRYNDNFVSFNTTMLDAKMQSVPVQCMVKFNHSSTRWTARLRSWIPTYVIPQQLIFATDRSLASEQWSSRLDNQAGTAEDASTPSGRRLLEEKKNKCGTSPLTVGADNTLSPKEQADCMTAVNDLVNGIDAATDNGSAVSAAQAAALAQLKLVGAAFDKLTKLLEEDGATDAKTQKSLNSTYDAFWETYRENAEALERKLNESNALLELQRQRSAEAFLETQNAINRALGNLTMVTGLISSGRRAAYESVLKTLAGTMQYQSTHMDNVQSNIDADISDQQTITRQIQNEYTNTFLRKKIASAIGTGLTPTSGMTLLAVLELMMLQLFTSKDQTPNTEVLNSITPYFYSVSYMWNTYATVDTTFNQGMFDFDVDKTVVDIYATRGSGTQAIAYDKYRQAEPGQVATNDRTFAHMRNIDISCSDEIYISLQNTVPTMMQLQQLFGPAGCVPGKDGNCRCWATVRRDRCRVRTKTESSTFGFQTSQRNTYLPPTNNAQLTGGLRLSSYNLGCIDNDASAPWFDPYDWKTCQREANSATVISASGKPSCEIITNITLLHKELSSVCGQKIGNAPVATSTTDSFVMQVKDSPISMKVPNRMNKCSTDYQIMEMESLQFGQTLPKTFYRMQLAQLLGYVAQASRAYELKKYGYVPKHGYSSYKPYITRGVYRAPNVTRYIQEVIDGRLTPWVDPVVQTKVYTTTYGSISQMFFVPVYDMVRGARTQDVKIDCTFPDNTEVSQVADYIDIQPAHDNGASIEPTHMIHVGWLESLREVIQTSPFHRAQRHMYAVPDGAIGPEGPIDTRRYTVEYVRCDRTCLYNRLLANSDNPDAVEEEDILSYNTHRFNGNNPLLRELSVDELLRAENISSNFDPTGILDSAHAYYQPLYFSNTDFLTLQDQILEGDPNFDPLLLMRGPIPVKCNMSSFDADVNQPFNASFASTSDVVPSVMCRYLETHNPISLRDPDDEYRTIDWDTAGYIDFADETFRTTFSFTTNGPLIGDTNVRATCPSPHFINLIPGGITSTFISILNDRSYAVTITLDVMMHGNDTMSTGASQLNCTRANSKSQHILSSKETTMLPLIVEGSACGNMTFIIRSYDHTQAQSFVSTCYTWSGDIKHEIQMLADAKLANARVPMSNVESSIIGSPGGQSSAFIGVETQLVQNTGDDIRISFASLFYTTNLFSQINAHQMIDLAKNISAIASDTSVIVTPEVVSRLSRQIEANKLQRENIYTLLQSVTSISMAKHNSVRDAIDEADAALLAFSEAMKNISREFEQTGKILEDSNKVFEQLSQQHNDSIARLRNLNNDLSSKIANLDVMSRLTDRVPLEIRSSPLSSKMVTVMPNFMDSFTSFWEEIGDGIVALPGLIVDLALDLVEYAFELAKKIMDRACKIFMPSFLAPFLCGDMGEILFYVIIVLAIIVVIKIKKEQAVFQNLQVQQQARNHTEPVDDADADLHSNPNNVTKAESRAMGNQVLAQKLEKDKQARSWENRKYGK